MANWALPVRAHITARLELLASTCSLVDAAKGRTTWCVVKLPENVWG